MMEKGQRLIPNGKHENGTPKQATTSICKVCGKEGLSKHKEYLFRVIVVTRPFLQDQVWAFTKLNSVLQQGIVNINKQYKQYPKFTKFCVESLD